MGELRHTPETARLEAILFACGDPISTDRLAQASELPALFVLEGLAKLEECYRASGSSLTVRQLGDSWQLGTREAYADWIQSALVTKKTAPLSSAAMEVLTIVAYNQPVTKSFVEHVRGIDSSAILHSLVEKELLEEAGRLEIPGRPIAYQTTSGFLRCFGFSSLEELPALPSAAAAASEPMENSGETV